MNVNDDLMFLNNLDYEIVICIDKLLFVGEYVMIENGGVDFWIIIFWMDYYWIWVS